MAYEHYKNIKTQEEFYSDWDIKNLKQMSQDIKDSVYHKYMVKCMVFQRDNFTCQNEKCVYCNNITEHSNLTMHHIKFKKNNGQDKVRNCITLCLDIHKRFHSGKDNISFNGQTFKIHQEDEINWKEIKKHSKKIRKENINFHNNPISWEIIYALMRFLSIDYRHLNLDDE